MSVSRRSFVRALGIGSAGALAAPQWIGARGLEAATANPADAAWIVQQNAVIRLMSNENPNGPVPAAIRAMQASFHEAAWYPAALEGRVVEALSKANDVPAEQIMLGSGSGEILKVAVETFCSSSRPLVAAHPTFETCGAVARTLGYPVREVPLDAQLRIDLDGMARQARGAGLVFLCNPNNPTGHVHGKMAVERFVRSVLDADPEVTVLIDEAYHEFVDDPGYASMLPMVAREPRVFVSRTFSKIYGLAGLRVGYAFGQPATLERMRSLRVSNGVGALASAAAVAAIADTAQTRKEQQESWAARAYTTKFFKDAGYDVVPSQTNFILVNIRRDTRDFRDACMRQGVAVGRPFPPLLQHSRISIGTMDEMRRATDVFQRVLG